MSEQKQSIANKLAGKLAKGKEINRQILSEKSQETKPKRKSDELDPVTPEKEVTLTVKKQKNTEIITCPELQGEEQVEIDTDSSENTSKISSQIALNSLIKTNKQIMAVNLAASTKESQGEGHIQPASLDAYAQIMSQLLAPISTQMTQFMQMQTTMHTKMTETEKTLKDNSEQMSAMERRMTDRIELISNSAENTDSRLSMVESSLEEVKGDVIKANQDFVHTQTLANENKAHYAGLLAQVKKLSEKQLQDEVRSRRNNLRFLGIPEDKGRESPATSEFKLRKVLKDEFGIEKAPEIKIVRAHRTGAQNLKYPRPIIACFENFDDKMAVWRARFNVSQSLLKCQEDFPTEILARRKILSPTFHAIRTHNLKPDVEEKFEVALVVDKLYVNNRLFNIHNIHHVLSPFKPEELANREIDGTIFFFGNASPFSNHHKCKFSVQNNNYMCMEQYMFAMKAQKAGDRNSFDKIMASSDPVEQKHLGAKVEGI
jgi:hypothetical protein